MTQDKAVAVTGAVVIFATLFWVVALAIQFIRANGLVEIVIGGFAVVVGITVLFGMIISIIGLVFRYTDKPPRVQPKQAKPVGGQRKLRRSVYTRK